MASCFSTMEDTVVQDEVEIDETLPESGGMSSTREAELLRSLQYMPTSKSFSAFTPEDRGMSAP